MNRFDRLSWWALILVLCIVFWIEVCAAIFKWLFA